MGAGSNIGLWVMGAAGSVATQVAVGLSASRRGLVSDQGLVTALPPFGGLGLPEVGDFVFGGHELRAGASLLASARAAAEGPRTLPATLVEAVSEDLAAMDAELRPGVASGAGSDPVVEVARLAGDIREFQTRHGLDSVIAVNLSSTEAVAADLVERSRTMDVAQLLLELGEELPPSVLFVAAAIEAGCPVVNFTPSLALDLLPLRDAAQAAGLPYCGRDGKTGETLLKSVLGPMFLWRHLRVLSWESYNLLGNRDGQTLADPAPRASKVDGKSSVLGEILDYPFHGQVHIDYVPSLDDWKTAWNLIHFEGFLGTRMSLQFTWQGCDSALAAPLVLDLARLAVLAQERGESGFLAHTAAFFKTPLEAGPADFATQMQTLLDYATST